MQHSGSENSATSVSELRLMRSQKRAEGARALCITEQHRSQSQRQGSLIAKQRDKALNLLGASRSVSILPLRVLWQQGDVLASAMESSIFPSFHWL
eukprot:3731090-Amphidinium_carterae.1